MNYIIIIYIYVNRIVKRKKIITGPSRVACKMPKLNTPKLFCKGNMRERMVYK